LQKTVSRLPSASQGIDRCLVAGRIGGVKAGFLNVILLAAFVACCRADAVDDLVKDEMNHHPIPGLAL
jgi:hypothetical protein